MLRNTPLKRTSTLKRTAMQRKPAKRHRLSDTRADIQRWREQHESCACCWRHYRTFGVVLQLHHILPGRHGRPNCTWNFLMLCGRGGCHERLDHGRENLAIAMYLKRESDDTYNPQAMQEWLVRVGTEILPPLPEALPAWIIEARNTT